MTEIEEKYKYFAIDEKMVEMFSHFSTSNYDKNNNQSNHVITTYIIDKTGKYNVIKENKDAKLV